MPLPPGASRQEEKEQLAQGTERKELSILQSPRIQVLGVVLFMSGVTEIQFCSWKTHSLPSCTWVGLHAELWAEFQTEVAFSSGIHGDSPAFPASAFRGDSMHPYV